MAFAFFDVDGTLISLKSMFSFQDYWHGLSDENGRERAPFETEMAELVRQGASREEMNRRYYAHFAGRSVAAVRRAASRWFQHVERSVPDLFHPVVVRRLLNHHTRGDVPVFVSGSFPEILAPFAERLGVVHILATDMEVANDRFTGTIRRQTIGDGKARAIAAFLTEQGADSATCHAYGDDLSDLPMMLAVGEAAAVEGDSRLEQYARDAGWEILPVAA